MASPGYRFYPTEEELFSFYLHNQLEGRNEEEMRRVIPVVNFYEQEPWDLPQLAGERCREDTEQWFFFVPRQEHEARGGRLNRSTASGYWKTTGSLSYVYSSDHRAIGLKKSMVFYLGKARTARKTKWKMNEYTAIEEMPSHPSNSQATPKLRHEFTLCRVYVISRSFRAFNHRPVVANPRDARLNDQASTSGAREHEGESMNGPETSRPVTDLDLPSSFDQPIWDWEQLARLVLSSNIFCRCTRMLVDLRHKLETINKWRRKVRLEYLEPTTRWSAFTNCSTLFHKL